MAMAEDSPPRVARALQRIQRAGRDMEVVIDAFLILAREAEVEPQSEDFDVADIVMDEAENARAAAQQAGGPGGHAACAPAPACAAACSRWW